MTSTSRAMRRCLAIVLVTVLLVLTGAPSALAGRRWLNRPDKEGPPGNLAVMAFKLYEVGIGSARHQLLARVLIENQSPLDRHEPYRVVLVRGSGEDVARRARRDDPEILGACGGASLPRGQVAVCDIWLSGKLIDEGETVHAVLDRSIESFDAWDGDPANDRRDVMLRTLPTGRNMLRIADWEVRPRILHGMGEVQFRFTVEGAHLVWLLTKEENEPRLVAGHPADGLLSGKGYVRVRESGPITVVARNSLGAFVYATIPVLNSYQTPTPDWMNESSYGEAELGEAEARILDPGVYEEDDNKIILENLTRYLETKNWAVELERLRRLGERDRLVPASVLNPKARER